MEVTNTLAVGDGFIPRGGMVELVVIDIRKDCLYYYVPRRISELGYAIGHFDIKTLAYEKTGNKYKIDITRKLSLNDHRDQDPSRLDILRNEIGKINYELEKIVKELHAMNKK